MASNDDAPANGRGAPENNLPTTIVPIYGPWFNPVASELHKLVRPSSVLLAEGPDRTIALSIDHPEMVRTPVSVASFLETGAAFDALERAVQRDLGTGIFDARRRIDELLTRAFLADLRAAA